MSRLTRNALATHMSHRHHAMKHPHTIHTMCTLGFRTVRWRQDTERLLRHVTDANGMITTARSEFKEVHRKMKSTRVERINLKNDSNILANRIKILKVDRAR